MKITTPRVCVEELLSERKRHGYSASHPIISSVKDPKPPIKSMTCHFGDIVADFGAAPDGHIIWWEIELEDPTLK